MADNNRPSSYARNNGGSSSSSSAAVDPGPWLSRLTIGYLLFLLASLYPLTTLVRMLRKRRKVQSAAARRNSLHTGTSSRTCKRLGDASIGRAGSPISGGNERNSPDSGYLAPTPANLNGAEWQTVPPPVVAIEMGTFVHHHTSTGIGSTGDKRDGGDACRVLLDLDDDEASVFVPITLPVRAHPLL